MKFLLLTVAISAASSTSAFAGPIGSACLAGGRSAANRDLCACIDRVADLTLSRSDQRRAAKLFKDPDMAQDVRMSDRGSDEDFWGRYKNFATAAEGYCSK